MDSPESSEDFQGRLLHQGENLISNFFNSSNKKGEKEKIKKYIVAYEL